MVFAGYHGTTAKNAAAIMRGNFKVGGNLGWLGRGVYFFDGNPTLAASFAGRNAANIKVIRCDISVDEDKLLDVTHPDSPCTKEFHQHRTHFIESAGPMKVVVKTARRHLDGIIIDHLCAVRNYHVVRAHTYTYTAYDREYHWSSHIPNGTELCVRDLGTLSSRHLISDEYYV